MSWGQAQSSRKDSKGRNIKKNMINLILIFKIFCSAKDIVKKMKRLVTVWEKHLQRISIKDIYREYIKNSQKLNNKETNNSYFKKRVEGLNKHIIKKTVKMQLST